MKFNTSRLLLFATLFFSVFSIRNIKSNSNQDDILKIFSELFTDPVGSKCKDIPVNPMINPAANNNIVTDDNGVTWNGPRKKINILDKQQLIHHKIMETSHSQQIIHNHVHPT